MINGKPLVFFVASLSLVQIALTAFLLYKLPNEEEIMYLPIDRTLENAAAATGQQPASVVALKLPDSDMLRASIEQILKDELGRYLANVGGATNVSAAPAQREDAPGNADAFRQAQAVVDQAVARGTWGDQDSTALMQQAGHLNSKQRTELMEKLYGALNRQELKSTGMVPAL